MFLISWIYWKFNKGFYGKAYEMCPKRWNCRKDIKEIKKKIDKEGLEENELQKSSDSKFDLFENRIKSMEIQSS